MSSCLVTTALCTWIVIHPRIYKRKKLRFPHKLALWLKTVVAPELIAVEAAQEWMQARQIVQKGRKCTGGDLNMLQAFYIGMLGIRYRTDFGTKVLWPNQFIWLLEENLLEWDQHHEWGLSPEIVRDKGNADSTAKLFALVQVSWFVAQSIMRAANDLPLAPLESMTLSYIPLFAIAYGYWWIKPKDIETPSVIDLPNMTAHQRAIFHDMIISEKFDDEDSTQQESMQGVWDLTPRLFEKEAEDRAFEQDQEKYRIGYQEHVAHMRHCFSEACPEPQHSQPLPPIRRKEKTLAHWDPQLYHSRFLRLLCCLAGISFPALHMISWHSIFPTLIETWLWRVSALVSMATMLFFMQFEKIVVSWRDPWLYLQLTSLLLYLATRVIMLVGAFAAFRAADPRLYETYVASNWWVSILS